MESTPLPPCGSWSDWFQPASRLRLGASACLRGEPVANDGSPRSPFLTRELGLWTEWVEVRPEVGEVGPGAPRPDSRAAADELDGLVLGRSQDARPADPLLPVTAEEELEGPQQREHFVLRVFARHRWRGFLRRPTREGLARLHASHELLLLVHDELLLPELTRLAAGESSLDDAERFDLYGELFHTALARRAPVQRHLDALDHALRLLKGPADVEELRDLVGTVREFAEGRVPLVVPLAMLRFYTRKHDVTALRNQLYLDPYPSELKLRNRLFLARRQPLPA